MLLEQFTTCQQQCPWWNRIKLGEHESSVCQQRTLPWWHSSSQILFHNTSLKEPEKEGNTKFAGMSDAISFLPTWWFPPQYRDRERVSCGTSCMDAHHVGFKLWICKSSWRFAIARWLREVQSQLSLGQFWKFKKQFLMGTEWALHQIHWRLWKMHFEYLELLYYYWVSNQHYRYRNGCNTGFLYEAGSML